MHPLTVSRAIEGVAVVLWGGVFAYFLRRFAYRKKLISVGIAVMSLGWILVALLSVQLWLKLTAVAAGFFLWWTVVRVEG